MLFQLCYLYVCLPVDMSTKVFEVNLIRVQKKVRKCTNSKTSQIHFFIFFLMEYSRILDAKRVSWSLEFNILLNNFSVI